MEGKKDGGIQGRDSITDQQVLNVAKESLARGANRMDVDVEKYVKAANDGTLPSGKGISGFLKFLKFYRKRK